VMRQVQMRGYKNVHAKTFASSNKVY